MWGGRSPPPPSLKLDSHQHGGMQIDANGIGPEKAERAWETCVLASLGQFGDAYRFHLGTLRTNELGDQSFGAFCEL